MVGFCGEVLGWGFGAEERGRFCVGFGCCGDCLNGMVWLSW